MSEDLPDIECGASRGRMNGKGLRLVIDDEFDCLHFSLSEVKAAANAFMKRSGMNQYTRKQWLSKSITGHIRELAQRRRSRAEA